MIRPLQPLRDGAGLFHEEPDELALVLESRGLRLIEPGRGGSPIGVLPFLEEEAIARLRHEVGKLVEDEPAVKAADWDHWRRMWVQEAHYFMRNAMQGPLEATVAYSAAEILVRAGELRGAIEGGEAERAAALAMLVASWVFTGGVSIRLALSEPVAQRHRQKQREKGQKERFAIKADSGKSKKSDFVKRAFKAAGQVDCGTAELWPHLFSLLDSEGLRPTEEGAKSERSILLADGKTRFTFKGVQRMLAELRSAPVKRGRPRKKPP